MVWPQSVLVGYLGKILYDGHFSVSLSSLFSCMLDTRKRECENMCGLQREYVYFAKGSWKFTRQQVMNTIWDKRGVKLKGTMPDMIRYFLILSLNRSTWMRARDKSLLLIHSYSNMPANLTS